MKLMLNSVGNVEDLISKDGILGRCRVGLDACYG